jgi:hypothetical protein
VEAGDERLVLAAGEAQGAQARLDQVAGLALGQAEAVGQGRDRELGYEGRHTNVCSYMRRAKSTYEKFHPRQPRPDREPRRLLCKTCANRAGVRACAPMLAHIAGIPVEETALSLAPVAFAAAGLTGARLRRLTAQRRPGRLRRDSRREALGRRP